MTKGGYAMPDDIAQALRDVAIQDSLDQYDREAKANLVDGFFAIAKAINRLAAVLEKVAEETRDP